MPKLGAHVAGPTGNVGHRRTIRLQGCPNLQYGP